MNAAGGEAALDAMIARMRRLRTFASDVAKRAAPLVEEVGKRSARAGLSPDGKAWTPLKYTGGRALANAANFISARAVGTVVQLVLTGPYVLHNFGTGHAPQRRIIPDGATGVPKDYRAAIMKAARERFAEIMGGGA